MGCLTRMALSTAICGGRRARRGCLSPAGAARCTTSVPPPPARTSVRRCCCAGGSTPRRAARRSRALCLGRAAGAGCPSRSRSPRRSPPGTRSTSGPSCSTQRCGWSRTSSPPKRLLISSRSASRACIGHLPEDARSRSGLPPRRCFLLLIPSSARSPSVHPTSVGTRSRTSSRCSSSSTCPGRSTSPTLTMARRATTRRT
mmetsp:Transcript_49682/g.106153  ORF Transcript_49682/g.106153 Transcript_49682/m.106153 type:complete len:201 (+) Transcript_49682:884-1486(+)